MQECKQAGAATGNAGSKEAGISMLGRQWTSRQKHAQAVQKQAGADTGISSSMDLGRGRQRTRLCLNLWCKGNI
jgi:hypothetical protein